VDAAQALEDLTEISSQIQSAVLFDESGTVLGSTMGDDNRSSELVRAANQLLEAATEMQVGDGKLTQLDAATHDGSVFVVRDGDRRIVATTGAEPTVGLVFYDLKSALRAIADEQPKPKRTRRKKAEEETADDA
jgi:predicted regulator of Ras-like GTPase activity (Roadblock/LC7/MglB family)